MGFGEGFGVFDGDRAEHSKREKEKLDPRAGIEPNIIPDWKEIIIQ